MAGTRKNWMHTHTQQKTFKGVTVLSIICIAEFLKDAEDNVGPTPLQICRTINQMYREPDDPVSIEEVQEILKKMLNAKTIWREHGSNGHSLAARGQRIHEQVKDRVRLI